MVSSLLVVRNDHLGPPARPQLWSTVLLRSLAVASILDRGFSRLEEILECRIHLIGFILESSGP